jgi:ribonuclease Z
MIEIIFLGTGSAVPTVRRNHPSIFLKYKNENILFDCGEGTQRQFRKAKLNPCKLTRLFISHWHGDHVLGIPGLLQTLALNNYQKTLEVYGPRGTKQFMERIMGLFIHTGKINIKIHEIDKENVFENEDIKIIAEKMMHGTETLAYSFIEKDRIRLDKNKLKKLKLPSGPMIGKLKQGKDIVVDGKKIKASSLIYKQNGKKVAIVLDTKKNENILKLAKDSDLLICEATYFDEEEMAEEYKHLTVKQAGEIAKKSKCKKLVLMHLSQKYENKEKEFLGMARKYFNNTVIAEDLMKIEVQ